MNRNQFIKLTGLSGFALATIPNFAFNQNSRCISYDELIGKGTPELFGDGFQVRKEAYDAFIIMKKEAIKNNIALKVVSSYRSFKHQNSIWERKYKHYKSQGLSDQLTIEKIIEYSTIPGTSRHHWGTDLDVVDGNVKQPKDVLNPPNFETDACFGPFKIWMDNHANDFGFYLVYTNQSDRKGFMYEPWHYSYKPLACEYISNYRQLKLSEIIKKEQLMGSAHFSDEFINRYVKENILDINPALL